MLKKYKLSKKKLKAFDKIFTYYENKDEDFILKEEIETQGELAEFLNDSLQKVGIKEVKITQADISRLKNTHKKEYRLKKDNEGNFVLRKTHVQRPLDRLAESIDTGSAKGFFDASVLALSVDRIYADRLGTDFVDSFPDEIIGYLKNDGLLLVIFKSQKAKEEIKKELKSRSNIKF